MPMYPIGGSGGGSGGGIATVAGKPGPDVVLFPSDISGTTTIGRILMAASTQADVFSVLSASDNGKSLLQAANYTDMRSLLSLSTAVTSDSDLATRLNNTGPKASVVSIATAAMQVGVPTALNTLSKIATSINNDATLWTTITTALGLKANLNSPPLTGVPTTPTAALHTATTQIASAAFVMGEIANHTHAQADIIGLATTFATKADKTELYRASARAMIDLADLKGQAIVGNRMITDTFDDLTNVVTWQTSVDPLLTTDAAGQASIAYRQIFYNGAFTLSGDKVRITIACPAATSAGYISEMFIGYKAPGTTLNFASAPTRVTFAGANTVTTPIAGQPIVSDEIAFALDKTQDIIVAVSFSATASYMRYTPTANPYYTFASKAAGNGEAANLVVTGYGALSPGCVLIDQIEVLNGPIASTNYVYDPANDLFLGVPSTSTIMGTSGDVTQYVANTSGPGYTILDRNYQLPSGSAVRSVGVYSSTPCVGKIKILLENLVAGTSYTMAYEQAINHPGGGWFDVLLPTPYIVPLTGVYRLGAYIASGASTIGSVASQRSYTTADITTTTTGLTADFAGAYVMRCSTGELIYGPSGGSGGGGYNSSTGNINGHGRSPVGYGGGASGGCGSAGGAAGNGAAGAPGLIIIQYMSTGLAPSLKTIPLTSGTSWVVPSDWNNSFNSVECIGAGGGGGNGFVGTSGTAGGGGGGGGGGAYSKVVNLSFAVGASITYSVGVSTVGAAGGDTWFNGATLAASTVGAKGGTGGGNATGLQPAGGGTAGVGGAAASGIGTVKYSGGNGGASVYAGAGGGGSAGPYGNGGNGSAPVAGAGGGGGGANGGANTAVAAGGANRNAQYASSSSGPGQSGNHGAGGAGAASANVSAAQLTGGAGGQDNIWFVNGLYSPMQINSIAFPVAIVPSSAYVECQILGNKERLISGTDYSIEVTRDNGTTWSPVVQSRIENGANSVYAGLVDLTTQPSGSTIRYREKSLNGKHTPLSAVHMQLIP